MPSPEPIEERFADLVRGLRSGRLAAPAGLRERVREIAGREPEPPSARLFRLSLPRIVPPRRAVLVLVPVVLVVAAGAAVGVGVLTSGSSPEREAGREGTSTALAQSDSRGQPPSPARALEKQVAPLPPGAQRAQVYEAEIGLRVRDLSATTKRALRVTRSLGGYVRSVEYGSGETAGRADLVLRVPIGSVQEALLRLTALGEILSQHVSIRDLQPAVDRRFRTMQALRGEIASLQRRLATLGAGEPERKPLEARLAKAKRRLVALQREQARLVRGASFATVSLELRKEGEAAAVPARPGRIERAFDRAGTILLEELTALVYALVVAGPLLLLAGLLLVAARSLRRRAEERLLQP